MASSKLTNLILIAILLLQSVIVVLFTADFLKGREEPLQSRQLARMLPPFISGVVIDESSGPPYVVHANKVLRETGKPTHNVLAIYPDFLLLRKESKDHARSLDVTFLPWSSVAYIEGNFQDD